MTMRNHRVPRTLIAGLLAAGLALPLSAHADDDDVRPGRGWGWGMGQMMQGWGNGPMMGYGANTMLDRIDGRLAYLETELKITDAQSAAWDAFATTLRDSAEAHNAEMLSMMEEMHDRDYFERPLPDRLALHESHMASRLSQIRDLKTSVEALYAVLDGDQKKTADTIVLPMMGMGMGMGMMGPGGGMTGPWMMGPGMMNR